LNDHTHFVDQGKVISKGEGSGQGENLGDLGNVTHPWMTDDLVREFIIRGKSES
jgi:hypothetical protein